MSDENIDYIKLVKDIETKKEIDKNILIIESLKKLNDNKKDKWCVSYLPRPIEICNMSLF